MAGLQNKIFTGNCLEIMRAFPDNFIQTVITSPPYWGLRDYGIPNSIFGGDLECSHEWNNIPGFSGRAEEDLKGRIQNNNPASRPAIPETDICSKCGAWRGPLGLEPSPELFIKNIMEIFAEVHRILRPDGTLWLNFGDSYWGSGNAAGHGNSTLNLKRATVDYGATKGHTQKKHHIFKPLDLIGMPWRIALALHEFGWYFRSEIIWKKRNPLPESASGWSWVKHKIKIGNKPNPTRTTQYNPEEGRTSVPHALWQECPGCPKCEKNNGWILKKNSWRPTKGHEHIFLLSKTRDYYGDKEDVLQVYSDSYLNDKRHSTGSNDKNIKDGYEEAGAQNPKQIHSMFNKPIGNGHNIRTVWDMPTASSSYAHFATFPEDLPNRCILSTTSEKACPHCGAPWARMIEKKSSTMNIRVRDNKKGIIEKKSGIDGKYKASKLEMDSYGDEKSGQTKTVGWMPTCECEDNDGSGKCIVLDPFGGTGTVAKRAMALGRAYIHIDVSEKYNEYAKQKTSQPNLF